ncbi:MAG: acyl-CoA thioesterase, partial [Pseudomonas sagittaria]|nr:acyl-CoA thioesterase [Pseudomonas sagittaria]
MNWELPAPFVLAIEVGAEHIDALGHANNAVYVGWLEQCAWAHSQSLGLSIDD